MYNEETTKTIIIKGSRHEIGRKYVQRKLGVDMIKYIIYIYEAIKCCINFKVYRLFMSVLVIKILFNESMILVIARTSQTEFKQNIQVINKKTSQEKLVFGNC